MSDDNANRIAPPQTQLYMKETYPETPRPVVPPNAAPKRSRTLTERSVFAPSRLSTMREFRNKPITKNIMVYETVKPQAVIFEEQKTLKERMSGLCRSTSTALMHCLFPFPSSELGDTESSTARLLSSYRQNPPYGYGSISAGAAPTKISDSELSTIPWRRRSSDSLVAQPTVQGNTIR